MVHLETTTSSPSAMSSSNCGYGRGEEQLAVAKTILAQAIDLVDKHLTSDEQLIVNSKYLPGSTIGKMKSSLSSEISCLPSFLQESICVMHAIISFYWQTAC